MSITYSKIGVVAPSGIFSPSRLAQSINLLNSWGIECVKSPNLFAQHLFTAGTPEQRIQDLHWSIQDPDINFIWFARGGYGTISTLSEFDWAAVSKPIMGFSDATAMLVALYQSGGSAIHGPVLHSLNDHVDAQSQTATRDLLHHNQRPVLEGDYLFGSKDRIAAPITGGNLCVLSSLCGTPHQLNANGHIVMLEDIGEPAYKIHRMLTQLVLSGSLDGAVGIALGEFTDCRIPQDANWTLEDVFVDALKPIQCPIYKNLPFGHGTHNLPWKYGSLLQLGDD